ncbi:MAG: hypothetical protein MMC33_003603 [Icmadophila ericetorum]|nr:hypothetical protein [Icmadophila ericetorum]
MSLVNLAHVCSHLQNASKARLGLTSVPPSHLILTLALALQHHGYISSVALGGLTPPPPTLLSTPSSSTTSTPPELTQTNIASRRLWLGLKYWDNKPVLSKMNLVSKPTRRIWMGREDLEGLAKGEKRGYVYGLREVGESLFVSTDRGIMEIREAVERGVGGMLLCRVV